MKIKGLVSSGASLSLSFQMRGAVPASLLCARMRRCVPKDFAGRVGEWLKPADCKSAAPCGLRRFESFPVHQALVVGLQKTAGQSHERCSNAVQFGAQAPLRKSAPRRAGFGGKRIEPG